MKKMINTERVEGRIYQHNLVKKTVQNQASQNFGKEFIKKCCSFNERVKNVNGSEVI